MKRKLEQKTTRQSLLKRISAETDLRRKLDIATGRATHFPFWRKQESELENFSFLHKAQALAKRYVGKTPAETRTTNKNFTEIGFNLFPVLAAIKDNDHKFFSRIAAMIQYSRKLESRKTYCDILTFCNRNKCGTPQNPCDGKALTAHVRSHGQKFGEDKMQGYENQVPRALRDICKKLGIILTRQR